MAAHKHFPANSAPICSRTLPSRGGLTYWFLNTRLEVSRLQTGFPQTLPTQGIQNTQLVTPRPVFPASQGPPPSASLEPWCQPRLRPLSQHPRASPPPCCRLPDTILAHWDHRGPHSALRAFLTHPAAGGWCPSGPKLAKPRGQHSLSVTRILSFNHTTQRDRGYCHMLHMRKLRLWVTSPRIHS